jgi:hypothetical protein
MASLRKDLRDKLEKTVLAARVAAEAGALEALTALGVDQGKAFEHLKPADKALRNQLRARGRQVGDILDDRSGKQTLDHLLQVVAYEHWHRMLFARFLAENGLLLEPENQVAVSLADVDELARDAKVDIWELAGRFAQRMLPAVFRADDPVLALTLARENRTKLERMVADLPKEVFLADDSLGWTYQFWQAQRKDAVNASGVKIGADELSPVTQLFTEDYMVDFLLHNTLGAWWAGKLGPIKAATEQEARDQAALPAKDGLSALSWTYLRFVMDEAGRSWVPAAGTFPRWPKEAKQITFLDPCMGSGHFIVFALPLLARLRLEEENLNAAGAVTAVLRDNIHGLELDDRCTQIAAFNLALTAWKLAGYQTLPALHLACSGLAPNATEAKWVELADGNQKMTGGMERLYRLFQKAAVLGSLINPHASEGTLLEAPFHDLKPLFEKALARETNDEAVHEMAVTARGIAKAAEILANQFTLVATNVPYLGQRKQNKELKEYCEAVHPDAKADLATCFIERCISFSAAAGTIALVTPQNWLFLSSYSELREAILRNRAIGGIARLGAGAFETIGGEVVNVALFISSNPTPDDCAKFFSLDVSAGESAGAKADGLLSVHGNLVGQSSQLKNPDFRLTGEEPGNEKLLEKYTLSPQGIKTGDDAKWKRAFWELATIEEGWRPYQAPVTPTMPFGGREHVIDWRTNGLGMIRPRIENEAVGKLGVGISAVGQITATIYTGEHYDSGIATIVPVNIAHLTAIWAFCSSPDFKEAVRRIDQKVAVTNMTLVKVPFDLAHWQKVSAEIYPNGLPKPFTTDPTQWLFNGHPSGSNQPLNVAVARLLDYRWPRQTGSSFPDCVALGSDDLESHADSDGIVCLAAVRGERTAADRLRTILSASLGHYDEHGLIAATNSQAKSLENWLRDDFFTQHCEVFRSRPFIWHVWDGRSDGFHALVNYHKLATSDGSGRKVLESLAFGYLGDWIRKQQDDAKRDEPGAEDRLTAAQALQHELKAIVAGEPPYDIFVRWKPLHEQPIGWEPDLNDGIRMNIRPFLYAKDVARKGAGILRFKPNVKWDKDRGKEPARPKADFPWFWKWDEATIDFAGGSEFDGNRWNDCHYTPAAKRAARERHNK